MSIDVLLQNIIDLMNTFKQNHVYGKYYLKKESVFTRDLFLIKLDFKEIIYKNKMIIFYK